MDKNAQSKTPNKSAFSPTIFKTLKLKREPIKKSVTVKPIFEKDTMWLENLLTAAT